MPSSLPVRPPFYPKHPAQSMRPRISMSSSIKSLNIITLDVQLSHTRPVDRRRSGGKANCCRQQHDDFPFQAISMFSPSPHLARKRLASAKNRRQKKRGLSHWQRRCVRPTIYLSASLINCTRPQASRPFRLQPPVLHCPRLRESVQPFKRQPRTSSGQRPSQCEDKASQQIGGLHTQILVVSNGILRIRASLRDGGDLV